jgi:hypothetical protein
MSKQSRSSINMLRKHLPGMGRTSSSSSTRRLSPWIVLAALVVGGCAHEGQATETTSSSIQSAAASASASAAVTLRGAVTGLDAVGLVLENNGTDAIALSTDGAFVFARPLAAGAPYSVTVAQQPEGESCSVVAGSGVAEPVESAESTHPAVVCVKDSLVIEGTVTGLHGAVLVANGDDVVSVAGDGSFFMPKKIGPATTYDVVVDTQPADPPQVCTVTRGHGVTGDQDVTDVSITCVDG